MDEARKTLQAQGTKLHGRLKAAVGELFTASVFEAAGWPTSYWHQDFSGDPKNGSYDAYLERVREMLGWIAEALGEKNENEIKTEMVDILRHVLDLRNKVNSPFVEFGKPPGSGLWPHCGRT